MNLESVNPVPYFDGKIVLEEVEHVYTVDGYGIFDSTTEFIEQFCEPFDTNAVSKQMARSGSWRTKERYANSVRERSDGNDSIECIAAIIRQLWKEWADLGTELHEAIEFFYCGKRELAYFERRTATNVEYGYFVNFHTGYLVPRNLEAFRMELRTADFEARLCGSIDGLFRDRHTRGIVMIDWKRVRELHQLQTAQALLVTTDDELVVDWPEVYELYDARFGVKRCKAPIEHVPDCNLWHYFLQQNFYRHYLSLAGILLQSMHLVVMHPTNDDYRVIDVPLMDEEVRALLAVRRESLSISSN